MCSQLECPQQCTPLSKIPRKIDCIGDLSKCNCKSYSGWEEHCHLCLTLSRSLKDSKLIRIKPGDVIRYRRHIDNVSLPLSVDTIRTISFLDGYKTPVITFFNSWNILGSLDNFQILKSYHIPMNDTESCLIDLPDNNIYRDLYEYTYIIASLKKED